jgi:transglutaminase-like putative cysteine protease/sugar lactone lactonase YvrE
MKTLATILLVALAAPGVQARPIGAVLGSIPAPGPCTTGLTFDGKHLWAADHKTDRLYRVERASGKVLATLPSPGYRPAGLAWDGKRLWNTDPEAGKLFSLDVVRGVADRTVDAPVKGVRSLAWEGGSKLWGGGALWIAAARKGRLHRIDRRDGTTLDAKKTPSGSAEGMAFDGRYLWVTDRVADKLHVVHPRSGEVIFSVEAPGPHATGIAFDGKHLWVADYQTDRIYKLEHRGDGRPVRKASKQQAVEFTHQLRNLGPGTLTSAQLFLAVPGDGPSQLLRGAALFTPRPDAMVKDQWDQKVARFSFSNLKPGAFATATMRARATLYDVQHRVYPHLLKGLGAIPAAIRRRYLQNDSKYALQHPVIQRAVKQAVGKERNPYWIARRIYRHIHQRMFYKLSGGWNVAPRVLSRGNGSCSEYSFVFIAMCRAAGIPARYTGALVVRKDDASFDDVFHRWVEVYLPGYGWLPVDPSRGDKKSEVKRADAFGHLEPAFLITTRGGGGSRYLGWQYNYDSTWTCKGRCEVKVEAIAEWSPLGKRRKGKRSVGGSDLGSGACK